MTYRKRNIGRIHSNIIVEGNKCYIQVSSKHPIDINERKINVVTNGALANIDLMIGDYIKIHNITFRLMKLEATNIDLDDTDQE